MTRRIVLVLCWLALQGCDDGLVLTGVATSLPEGDSDARMRLRTLDIEVWPASSEACRMLIAFRHAVCGRECTEAPSPGDDGATPSAAATLTRPSSSEPWGEIRLEVDDDGPWDVVVRGGDDAGDPFLYGCSTIGARSEAVVRLWRPWCDTAACAAQFHPSCAVDIDCTVDPGTDPDGLGPPRCVARRSVEFPWEQDGIACPPPTATHFAPCHTARVSCAPGETVPVFDGVCPTSAPTECGGSLAADLDCDGRFPGPCGSCVPGDVISCGSVGVCTATARCGDSGTWEDCVLPPGTAEQCGGGDQDCDGIDDGFDPDAFNACNAGRGASIPAADACTGDACRCGSGPSCGAGRACCDGACVDVNGSSAHCGGCGRACGSGQRCAAGSCIATTDAGMPDAGCTAETCGDGDEDCDGLGDATDPDALADCNSGRAPSAPRASGCSSLGACSCGPGAACSGSLVCCGDDCVDTTTSALHCGTCGTGCDPGDACVGGVCTCVPALEECNGADEDCDGVHDSTDPDALASCNDERPADQPRADSCDGGGGCQCGGGAPCPAGSVCCGDPARCYDASSSGDHCGRCGNDCAPGQTCVGGTCVS